MYMMMAGEQQAGLLAIVLPMSQLSQHSVVASIVWGHQDACA